MKFSKTLFGFKPGEVTSLIESMENEHQLKINEFKSEIEKVKVELQNAEAKRDELQKQLDSYVEREKMISDVMVTAQINAQRIEEQARERAAVMLESAQEELKQKLQELDFLRIKVARFKEEFREVLDNYRVSLEKVRELPDDPSFTPTLVTKENRRHDVSS
jgi:chromosome segregation ATPase